MTDPAVQAELVERVFDLLIELGCVPYSARIGNFTDDDIQSGAWREANREADEQNRAFCRRIVAVVLDAYRGAVLASRLDAERIDPRKAARRLLRRVEYAAPGGEITSAFLALEEDVTRLLAALADETVARQAAEADRDLLVRVRDEAVGKTADYAEVIRRVRDRLDALAEGELAHRSPDYGRGVAQAVREIRAVLDGAADPAVDEEETLTEALSADHWA